MSISSPLVGGVKVGRKSHKINSHPNLPPYRGKGIQRLHLKQVTLYNVSMPSQPSKKLDTFPNPNPDRDYVISFECPEFTCLCPKTGQPDFATIRIEYVPDKLCVELKSLKLYLWSYRNEGAFHEAVTNKILDDLVEATKPRKMKVVGDFFVRGGIHTVITAEF